MSGLKDRPENTSTDSVAVVTAEQRAREVEERKAVETGVSTLTEEERKQLIQGLSIRDRLMARTRSSRIPTVFKDPSGEFTIYTRMMTGDERERAFQLNADLRDAANYGASIKGMREMLRELCVTPGLPFSYWDTGEASDDVVLLLILNTLSGTAKSVSEGVSRFRPE